MSAIADDTRAMSPITDTFADSIASAVRAELGRQGKRLTDLTAPLGLSRQTISGRLNGHTPFTADELDKVASFLGITAYDLIDSAALGKRFSDANPSPEAPRITPPQQDAWAQPSRSRSRRAS